MALEVEGVVDGGVDAETALCGASRFEALHFPLPSSHDLMRVLGRIVHPQPLLMSAGQAELPECGGIGAQLVGDRPLGRKALLLEQLAHQPHGRPLIPARLDQQIEDFALLIDGTPQVHPPAGDPHDHLVEVPPVARPRPSLAQASRDRGTEFEHPAPDRFVGQIDPAFGKQFLDVAIRAPMPAYRRFGAKPRKNFVDDQAASPSSWKTPRMAVWMAA
jgi:hypothetical protein